MKYFVVYLIKIYQIITRISYLIMVSVGINPHACKHQPSCSQYAIEVVIEYGTIQGLIKASKRLLSCR